MVPVYTVDAEPPMINAEHPFNQHGTAFGPPKTTALLRSVNNMPSSVVAATGMMGDPPNLPETTGTERHN